MATSPPGGDRLLDPEPKPAGGHGHGHAESDVVLSGPTHDLAYEPDQFAVKTILVVPAAVIGTALLAFVITWIAFAYVFDPRKGNPPGDVQAAADRGAAPLNDRFSRISSTDPKAEIQQPRLEGLQKTQVYYRDGNPANKDPSNLITAEMITAQPTRDGNAQWLHAEDLRPDRVRELSTYGEDKQAGLTRMPVDQAIKLAVTGGLLPTQEGARRIDVEPEWDRPKESNAGHGRAPEAPRAPPPTKKDDKEKK